MQRHEIAPRADWRNTVESQGLTYAVDRAENGNDVIYWDESAAYELSEAEVNELEDVTDDLHAMCIEACKHMIEDLSVMSRLGLPAAANALLRTSLAEDLDAGVYGRFDLAYDGTGPAKLLEYNADTPAALVESAVTQWHWLEDVRPQNDQWNLLHERLVRAWQRLGAQGAGAVVHFAVGEEEPNEDWATVAYLRETAAEAGVTDLGVTMEEIGWDDGVGFVDGENQTITTCFKMYPWEWMLGEEFGPRITTKQSTTAWIEPPWKLLAGSKAILPVLWHLYPDHENLVPAFFDTPGPLARYVAKPLFGWEGAGVELVDGERRVTTEARHTEGQPQIFQQLVDLPRFGPTKENHVVLGTWVVDGQASGLGIRESTHPVTDALARFVPHFMSTPRTDPAEVQKWLDQPSP